MLEHVIKAAYSDSTIRVYQAYRPEIAMAALKAGRFVPPFKAARMTWIKPSFNWVMYRSGYATKPGQDVILGIDITREGFEWALEHGVLSSFNPRIHSSSAHWQQLLAEKPVRIQWDPARDWRLNVIDGVRTIQVGLSGVAVEHYVRDWTVHIENVTPVAQRLAAARAENTIPDNLLDKLEVEYPLNPRLRSRVVPSDS